MVVNSKPTNLNKLPGQYMHSKAAKKLNTIKCYRLFNRIVAVIFGNKCNLVTCNVEDALVGDGNPMCVLPQVFRVY